MPFQHRDESFSRGSTLLAASQRPLSKRMLQNAFPELTIARLAPPRVRLNGSLQVLLSFNALFM